MLKYGFFDLEGAKKHFQQPRSNPLRQIPRICIPGAVISRAIAAITYPVVLAGPELVKRLEPRVARLYGISSASRGQRILRAVMLWLLEEPDSALEATEDFDRPETVLPIYDPELRGLPLEKQMQIWEDFGISAEAGAMPLAESPEGSRASPAAKIRGVR